MEGYKRFAHFIFALFILIAAIVCIDTWNHSNLHPEWSSNRTDREALSDKAHFPATNENCTTSLFWTTKDSRNCPELLQGHENNIDVIIHPFDFYRNPFQHDKELIMLDGRGYPVLSNGI